jgi:hypothetical protein
MRVQAARARVVDVAVGDQRAPERHSQLAAVSVSGEDRVVAVCRELVEYPQVRRVGDAQPHVGRLVRPAGDVAEPVVRQMRIVDAGECDRRPLDLQAAETVREVDPADVVERLAEVAPGQRRAGDRLLPRVWQEIPQRILRHRPPVVVGAEDVDARHIAQVAEGVHDHRDRVMVAQIVAGVDQQIRLEGGQRAKPGGLAALRRGDVDVGQVQRPNRVGSGGKAGDLDLAEAKRPHLVARRVSQSRGAEGGDAERSLTERMHGTRVSHWDTCHR